MLLSVVIPAYNASNHIEKALRSVFDGWVVSSDWRVEVVVVDDGSADGTLVERICRAFPDTRYLRHPDNKGMCAARNSGIAVTSGDYVTLLDSDDEFIPGWASVWMAIVDEWPLRANVCFTPCVNDAEEHTCSRPGYVGWMTAEDLVVERLSGEYNPIFRGDYIRKCGYADIGTRKSCGLLTYLRMAEEAPFWVTDRVQRIYHDGVDGSVTSGWTRPEKAAETYRCFSKVLEQHGGMIRSVSEGSFCRMRCKSLVYGMLAGRGRDFGGWVAAFSLSGIGAWVATLVLLIAGPAVSVYVINNAKKYGALRRYG